MSIYQHPDFIPPNMSVVGTCSLCGGPVGVERVFHSVIPPTPVCLRCGAIPAEAYGPTIPMRPVAPVITRTYSDTTECYQPISNGASI